MPRNGLGRAKRVEVVTPTDDAGLDIAGRLREATSVILTPPRLAAAVALGGSTLVARAVALVLGAAADEGERQLTLVETQLRGVALRWWG